jgi:hypothetical protein
MLDQNEGLSQATQDAGALELIFSKEHLRTVGQDARLGPELYGKIQKKRALTAQAAS